ELDELAGGEALGREPGMFGVETGDRDGEMAVAVAEVIGLLPPLVDGQLDLEARFRVREIDQRETVEVEPVRDLEPEGAGVEVDRSRLVENADHRMDCLGHATSSLGDFGKAR